MHTPKNNGTCYLKNVIGPLVYSENFITGIISYTNTDEPPAKRRLMFYDYDSNGNRIIDSESDTSSNNDNDNTESNNQQEVDIDIEAQKKAVSLITIILLNSN